MIGLNALGVSSVHTKFVSDFARLSARSRAMRILFARRRTEPHIATRRSRSAFAITDTELRLIAAAAIIGLRRMPKNG